MGSSNHLCSFNHIRSSCHILCSSNHICGSNYLCSSYVVSKYAYDLSSTYDRTIHDCHASDAHVLSSFYSQLCYQACSEACRQEACSKGQACRQEEACIKACRQEEACKQARG